MRKKYFFRRFAETTSQCSGSPWVFSLACGAVLLWGVTGPLFHFSDSWQLVINTSTTIITFLMVFLIQNTQNREARALQVKLDELLRATRGAHLGLIDLEELDEEDLLNVHKKYLALAHEAHARIKSGADDGDTPEIVIS